jgi:hypothetical protein
MLLSNEAVQFLRAKDFPAVFDELFVRGGFGAYTAAHGDNDCEKFVEDFETTGNMLMVEAVCACRFIQLLPHPCDALMLLVEGGNNVKRLGERCMLRVFDVKVLVMAIRIFCHRRSAEAVWETFPVSRMFEKRSRKGWIQFASDMYVKKRRLDKWWSECAEPRGDMGVAIQKMAEKEMDRLAENLMHVLRIKLLERKLKEQEGKRVKEACKTLAEGESQPKKRKYTPRPVSVSKKEDAELLGEVAAERSRHLMLLEKLRQVFTVKKISKVGVTMAGIVGALARVYPLIKWNLKKVVHQFATERSTFDTERKLFLHSLDLPASNSARCRLERMV